MKKPYAYIPNKLTDLIGIPSDQKEKIFVIFQRIHGRDEYDGIGIGPIAEKLWNSMMVEYGWNLN